MPGIKSPNATLYGRNQIATQKSAIKITTNLLRNKCSIIAPSLLSYQCVIWGVCISYICSLLEENYMINLKAKIRKLLSEINEIESPNLTFQPKDLKQQYEIKMRIAKEKTKTLSSMLKWLDLIQRTTTAPTKKEEKKQCAEMSAIEKVS
ncbi:hypothetical protein X798_02148 [Onchocerca flexuosa]|uniref:Uncharacterized protein n=1 Tax=Onchocerca flexuosa TaxID=387005 RepID=A0A238C0S9_9BILA|nr:hypothetical protein X798_02148 [Onchocerca flexuosa]